jgi:hypothetical protein
MHGHENQSDFAQRGQYLEMKEKKIASLGELSSSLELTSGSGEQHTYGGRQETTRDGTPN